MLQQALKLYSNLFNYPNESFVQDAYLLRQKVQKNDNNDPISRKLDIFIKTIGQLNTTDLQELHTQTFDLRPVCSPHIGFHLFGESYKRGSLMAELKREYYTYGIEEGSEIPDHISLILQYLSVLSNLETEQKLYEDLLELCFCPGLEKMISTFEETTNPYKYLLESLSILLKEQNMPSKVEVNSNV